MAGRQADGRWGGCGQLPIPRGVSAVQGRIPLWIPRQIWDALENPGKHPSIIEQLRSRYAFVLARHIESVIDQGQLDSQRNKESVPESSAPIGGLRGEVQSWLPQSYVQRFYRVGIQSLTATGEELAELRSEVHGLVDEILNRLHMSDQGQGIGHLITMHTLDFDVQARGDEYEAGSGEQEQERSDDSHA